MNFVSLKQYCIPPRQDTTTKSIGFWVVPSLLIKYFWHRPSFIFLSSLIFSNVPFRFFRLSALKNIKFKQKIATTICLNLLEYYWNRVKLEPNLMCLNQYRSLWQPSTKFDTKSIRFEAITFLVYIKQLLAMNKFLTNLSATPQLFTKTLPANSRSTLFTRSGKATLRIKFV